MGETIEFQTNGSTTAGYLATPGQPGPGILVLQEWWGLVDHIKQVADRFAEAGFVALAPDLYHGEDTTSPDEAGRLMMALDIERAAKDLQGAATYLAGREDVAGKIAALGFCMGGQLALFAATQHPEIAATVDFYGIHPHVKPDFAKMNGPVLCHWGKTDGFVTTDAANALVAEMEAAGVKVDSHHYDAGHAFFNDSRPVALDQAAADLAWERTLAFLRAQL